MIRQQQTIDKEFSINGLGLHTGNEVSLRFMPAPAGSGITFVIHTDNGTVEVPANITSVPANKVTPRNTTLTLAGTSIHTVEHLLASCYGLQIDNLIIEIQGNEPPVPSTGSYEAYVRAFREIGIVSQGAPARYLEIDRPVTFSDGDVELIALPSDKFRISFTIQYPNRHIGTQHATFEITPDVFEKEISPARTFVLSEDVEKLREIGLIKGGSLENAIVFNEDGIVNDEPLRFPDECVRHKVLDLIGDLSLLGQPIKGHIHAIKSGHSSNLGFVRKLWDLAEKRKRALPDAGGVTWGIEMIQEIMPHRYPFLLVDRIVELEDRKRVVGIKNVTINEPFFSGHFPGHPIMPAVLIIEAMAQVGGILFLNTVDNPHDNLVYFSRIDKARFRKPVLPGDQLRFELELLALKLRVCKMKGLAYVGDDLVAEAELIANIIPR
jgi:UDP-3-O-[3-hydroxymyristoyl] N-acetylglucosamine deacetylase/3-hydroxyacyl-[acyl-carrier-protein] dehydratase